MIIFDLDGCLADNRHRLHLVDYNKDLDLRIVTEYTNKTARVHRVGNPELFMWQPNWPAYWDACDKDEPIQAGINLLQYIGEGVEYGSDTPWVDYKEIQIWSGRNESIRTKTSKWIRKHLEHSYENQPILKLRPEGETCPDEVLFEKWLYDLGFDKAISDPLSFKNNLIDMAFSGNPAVIEMWKRWGVPCFQVHY